MWSHTGVTGMQCRLRNFLLTVCDTSWRYGYLSSLCQPMSSILGRRHLRSADRGELDYPRTVHERGLSAAFAYASRTNWNSLPDDLRNINHSLSTFKRHFKTFFFSSY